MTAKYYANYTCNEKLYVHKKAWAEKGEMELEGENQRFVKTNLF